MAAKLARLLRGGVRRGPMCLPVSVLVGAVILLMLLGLSACGQAGAPSASPSVKPAASSSPAASAPASASASASASAKPAAMLTINAGLIYAKGGFHNTAYWIAFTRGIFQKNGVEVKMTDFSAPNNALNSVGKDVDYTTPSPQVLVQFYKSGRKDVRILAVPLNTSTVQFIVTKDSPIKTIQELKGKKIGITLPGGSCHTGALLMLREAGIKPEEATFVTGGSPVELWTAAKTGQTDVACGVPPVTTQQVTTGDARYLWKQAERVKTNPMEGVFISTTDVVKNKKEALQRVVSSYVEAAQWIESNREEAGKIVAQQMGIPEAIGVAVLTQDLPKGVFLPTVYPEALQAVEDTMRLGGTLDLNEKIPWSEIVDTSFLPAEYRKEIK